MHLQNPAKSYQLPEISQGLQNALGKTAGPWQLLRTRYIIQKWSQDGKQKEGEAEMESGRVQSAGHKSRTQGWRRTRSLTLQALEPKIRMFFGFL